MADDFYSTYLPHAQEASQRTGIDPRLILAQAALESGWGKHAPGNNMFGIKSHGQAGGNTLATTEYGANGQPYQTNASFRGYDSPGASFGGYADFMLANPRYKEMMGAQGLEAQAAALGKSGYATDPNYGASVLRIAQGFPGGDGVSAINGAAGIKRQGGPALAFAGNGEEDDSELPAGAQPTSGSLPAAQPTSGQLKFSDDGGSGKQDNRFGLGDLFGASDETKAKMHGIGARLVRAAAALSSGVNPNQSSQLNALGKSLEEQNKTDYQYTMGPNGQLVKINKDTGEVSFATLPGGGKGSFGIVMGKDPTTGSPMPIGKINHNTGEYSPYGGQQGTAQAQEEQPTTMDDLRSLNPTRANAAQAVLDGAVSLPKINTRSTPEQRQLRNDVLAIGATKGLDESKFTARNTIYKNLNNKSASQLGGQLTQLGHSGDIMAQLSEDAEGLHNSSYRIANSIPAALGNNSPAFQEYAGKAAGFDQKADGLIGELSKLYNGSQGGGVTERAIMRQNTPRASDPPEIIASKMQALRDLYESRMHEMKQQIAAPFGDDADSVLERYLPKTAQASLDRTAASIGNLHTGKKSEATAKSQEAPKLDGGWKYLGSK